jgi:hypothetical protein
MPTPGCSAVWKEGVIIIIIIIIIIITFEQSMYNYKPEKKKHVSRQYSVAAVP